MIKSEEEIRHVTNSLRVTERALLSTYDKVHEGMTELDVANELRIALAAEKADCSWVEMGGPVGVPTYPNPKHVIKRGEILHIDIGSIYEGYACDTSRDAVIGKPSDRQRRINEIISDALEKAIEVVRPGVRASDVFKIGQETVRKTFPQYWRHQIGHGTGIIPHEPPRISPENDRPLRAGMVLDIEIPYYIYGFGTFNVEDTVVVTEHGHEVLSRLGRQLSILD
jgi:Xaa-Pro aminopeptidase